MPRRLHLLIKGWVGLLCMILWSSTYSSCHTRRTMHAHATVWEQRDGVTDSFLYISLFYSFSSAWDASSNIGSSQNRVRSTTVGVLTHPDWLEWKSSGSALAKLPFSVLTALLIVMPSHQMSLDWIIAQIVYTHSYLFCLSLFTGLLSLQLPYSSLYTFLSLPSSSASPASPPSKGRSCMWS